jgi:hypothetical protein
MPSERIREFYDLESFAVVGMSLTAKNISWSIFEQLTELGKRVYPINPKEGDKGGIHFYKSLDSLPEKPEGIIICVDLSKTQGLLESVKNSDAKYIWFQQGCFDNEDIAAANRLGLDPIKGCAMMYMPGTAVFHRFHRALNELFGKGYK